MQWVCAPVGSAAVFEFFGVFFGVFITPFLMTPFLTRVRSCGGKPAAYNNAVYVQKSFSAE